MSGGTEISQVTNCKTVRVPLKGKGYVLVIKELEADSMWQHQCSELSSVCLPVSHGLPNNTLPSQQQKEDLKRECEKQMHSAEILQVRKEEADEENQVRTWHNSLAVLLS